METQLNDVLDVVADALDVEIQEMPCVVIEEDDGQKNHTCYSKRRFNQLKFKQKNPRVLEQNVSLAGAKLTRLGKCFYRLLETFGHM